MDIKGFLKRIGMTQTELADRLCVTSQNVNRWVTGKGTPSYEMCQELLRLGITVEELFDVEYKNYPKEFWDISTRDPSEEQKRFQEGVQKALLDLIGRGGTQKQ